MATEQIERLNAALAGRYTLDREIGHGGMATVYLARDVKHRREVAVKVLRPELASTIGLDRFPREIDVVASLSHPHILPLHDSGSADGLLFYVMPFVRGESLRQRLKREGPLPVDLAVDLARQVAAALEYAHAHDVIHRDIKPENILLHEGEAVVADFGIAVTVVAASDERVTGETGLVLGTPEYMSPEQVKGEPALTPSSDVYSLGCVLYELLTGEPPFAGPSPLAAASKRLTDPPPDVRARRDAVPPHVARAIAKAMARDPADRFASAADFAIALSEPAFDAPCRTTVAVLPFRNLSPDPENEYFADGITEDIIAQLSKIRALRVISRGSVMKFRSRDQSLREIGARLDAGTVVDGSVRRAGGRVRIVAQLVDAASDEHLWAETYDRELTDVFEIQSDVAVRVAAALQARLSSDESTRIRREPTHDMQAYQAYLRGRHWLVRYTQEGIRQGLEYFEQAIRLDPEYAAAHVGVAIAYLELGENGVVDTREAYPQAIAAARKALALDPELAEAHSAFGILRAVSEFDWVGAEQELRAALALNPSSADAYDFYARVCSATRRFDEAVRMERRAQELDPLAHRSDLATSLLRAERYDEALEEAQRAVTFDPDYDRSHATLGWAYARTGRYEDGIAELEKAVHLSPSATGWLGQLGQMLAEAGQEARARDVLRRLSGLAARQFVSPYHVAYVHTGLGEHDAAIDLLERAVTERAGAVYGVAGSFLFAPLRPHPRFVALMKTMNLG